MLRYQNNAFRVLGLQPNVSMHEIMKRVNEIKVKKSLGMEIVYEYDFPWIGKLDRSEHNVINALQRLENPVSRLKEEIFWFWFETDRDKKAINYLKKNDHQAAHKTWKALITSENPTKKSISAFMNQIILAHSTVIGAENNVRYGDETKKQKKKNITLNEKHWKNWRFVINRFALIASNEVFWEMVKNKAERIDDPRLSSIKVDKICDNFIQDIVEPNITFMSHALISKDYERVKQHSSLLDEPLLPSEVLRKGFNKVLTSQTLLLNRYSKNTENDINKVKKGEREADKTIIGIYSKLNDKVTDIIYEGNLVDPNSISDFALAKNELAKAIRNCAIALNNILVADTNLLAKEKESEACQAYEMIRKAFEYATTIYTRKRYEEDEEVIKKNLVMVQTNIQYHKKISSKAKWKYIFAFLFCGAIILFFIIIPNLPDNSSSNKPPPSASSYNNSTTYNSQNDLSKLKIRIENLADEIKKKETRILELEATLKAEGNKIEALEFELEKVKSRIEGAIVGSKDKLIDEYNQKIEQYDNLVNSYNKVYLEYDKLFDEYEEDIITYDSLLESYNTGIIPPVTQNQLSEEEVSGKIYVVEVGDSLWGIAQKFGTTVEKIIACNEIADPKLITPGQKLIIPTE